MSTKPTYFYTDKPLFGLDIGHDSIKVMQLEHAKKTIEIAGYGATDISIHAVAEGVITDPKAVAKAVHELFRHHLTGDISARRVAMAVPSYRTFSRTIQLPKLTAAELREAVQLEAEQYIPVPLQELYLDYTPISQTADGCELFIVAVPKKIVDSYLELGRLLGLEVIQIEPTMAACARYFERDKQSNMPSVIIDFGSMTSDISIIDKTILATSTVPAGGLVFTEAIRNRLQVTQEEAGFVKTKYGLGSSVVQKQVIPAVEPTLQKLVTEIRRMMRYYEERYGPNRRIEQVIMLGGGSNMVGLGDYLTNALQMPVRTHNHPWALFDHPSMKMPAEADRLMFATVAGLSLLDPKQVFRA